WRVASRSRAERSVRIRLRSHRRRDVGGGRRGAPRLSTRRRDSVASGRNASRAAGSGGMAIARSAPSRNQRATEGLLPRHGEGEFAVADAPGKALGETRRRLLAVGRDEFGKGGEQARLRQAVPVDTVDAR